MNRTNLIILVDLHLCNVIRKQEAIIELHFRLHARYDSDECVVSNTVQLAAQH